MGRDDEGRRDGEAGASEAGEAERLAPDLEKVIFGDFIEGGESMQGGARAETSALRIRLTNQNMCSILTEIQK